MMRNVIPHHTEDYFPLLAAIFIYVFLSNLLGVIPGFLPPTSNINTNLAIGLTVFIYYNAMGIKRTGFKNYLNHFLGPTLWLAPLMFVIELIGHSVRPVSLSLRLFGNINGDHLVLSTFAGLTPLVVPVVFSLFGIFVAFIQAFVFTLLSTIYVGLAVETHGH
jgi:F-type H+-transporting ATPase subunit a